MTIFDELKASLREAVAIKTGAIRPARVTRYERVELKPTERPLAAKRSFPGTDC